MGRNRAYINSALIDAQSFFLGVFFCCLIKTLLISALVVTYAETAFALKYQNMQS